MTNRTALLTIDGRYNCHQTAEVTLEDMKRFARRVAEKSPERQVRLRYVGAAELAKIVAADECLVNASMIAEVLRDRAAAKYAEFGTGHGKLSLSVGRWYGLTRQLVKDMAGRFVADADGRLCFAGSK